MGIKQAARSCWPERVCAKGRKRDAKEARVVIEFMMVAVSIRSAAVSPILVRSWPSCCGSWLLEKGRMPVEIAYIRAPRSGAPRGRTWHRAGGRQSGGKALAPNNRKWRGGQIWKEAGRAAARLDKIRLKRYDFRLQGRWRIQQARTWDQKTDGAKIAESTA